MHKLLFFPYVTLVEEVQEVENVNEMEQEEEEEEEENKETEISQQSTLTPQKIDTKVIVSPVNPIWPVFYCCVKN